MHFTYEERLDTTTLNQGDVLRRTEGVEALLKEVHPHYFNKPDYPFFIVLTQSCDLVRRKGSDCASRYITIAAVRPLTLALQREIASYQYAEAERLLGFCSSAHQAKATQFVERLLNNNEPPYFFLERETGAGLTEECCAFLRLSIAVKAELHYDTLRAAKILQLKDSFQHKLGFLVGNLYSRIGTADWVPEYSTRADFDLRVKKLIEGLVYWVEKDIHKRVLKDLDEKPVEALVSDDLLAAIEAHKRRKEASLQAAADAVGNVLTDLGVTADLIEKAKTRLRNQPTFSGLIK